MNTKFISKDTAIERLRTIHQLLTNGDLETLATVSHETMTVGSFLDRFKLFDIKDLQDCIDVVLETRMDKPFFRFSEDEDYIIKEEKRKTKQE